MSWRWGMVWERLGQCYWTQRSLIRGRVWQGLMEEKGSQDVSPGWGGSHTKHWLFITAWLTQCVCVKCGICVDVCACVQSRESEKMCVHLYCELCVCTWPYVHVFLTSLLRHSSRESGVKWKSGSHSVGIHGSGPHGLVRAPLFTDKASPAGPRHILTHKGEQQKERDAGDGETR